jgi:hypothetical protein
VAVPKTYTTARNALSVRTSTLQSSMIPVYACRKRSSRGMLESVDVEA